MKYNPLTIIDKSLLKIAGDVTYAYNWATGKQKSDLANKLLTVAPILESVGVFYEANELGHTGVYTLAFIGTLLSLGVSHFLQKENLKMQKLENDALEKNCKNIETEKYFEFNKGMGAMYASVGTLLFYIPSLSNDIAGSGIGIRSLSHYVMRTENLPPRKNVLSRAKDRIEKYFEETEPLSEPILVPAEYSGMGLMEKFI